MKHPPDLITQINCSWVCRVTLHIQQQQTIFTLSALQYLVNWKMWQLGCIATWGRTTPRLQSLSAFISLPIARLKSLNLSAGVLAFYCSCVTLHCDLDLWPLTLNLRSVSHVTCWNSVPNLSEIEQSAAELLRFQYLTLWPWTCLKGQ